MHREVLSSFTLGWSYNVVEFYPPVCWKSLEVSFVFINTLVVAIVHFRGADFQALGVALHVVVEDFLVTLSIGRSHE